MSMLQLKDTKLEVISFSKDEIDTFYTLINLKKNPDGIDVERLSKTSPLQFDEVLNQMGCIFLLSQADINQLEENEEIDKTNLHEEIFNIARREDLL